MNGNSRIFVAGHKGLVGSALLRTLKSQNTQEIITANKSDLDLRDPNAVGFFFKANKPDYVYCAAAKVGGILANDTYPADFLYDNTMIAANVIHAAFEHGVKKLLFLGSTCIYPRLAPQPLKEEYLLTGPLESTNEWYAIAKIAGIKLCQAYQKQYGCRFISAMPTNLYGPGDNFDLETSHVLPALIRKFHDGKVNNSDEVVLWGTGKPLREFCHVDDCASACIHLMEHYEGPDIVNIGVGYDISIQELALLVKEIVGYQGEMVFDKSKPDGTPRKLVDVSRISGLGWKARIPLEEGIRGTYKWYLDNCA
jgi:GDP-L-fucose synthase